MKNSKESTTEKGQWSKGTATEFREYRTRSRTISELQTVIAELQNKVKELQEEEQMSNICNEVELKEQLSKYNDLQIEFDKKCAESNHHYDMYVKMLEQYDKLEANYFLGMDKAGKIQKDNDEKLTKLLTEVQEKWKAEAAHNIALRNEILDLKYGKDA